MGSKLHFACLWVFVLSLLTLPYNIYGNIGNSDPLPIGPGYYTGFIEGIYPFELKLELVAGDLSGTVFFPLSGDSLIVELDALDQKFLLTEFDPTHMQVGYFLIENQGEVWQGNWQNHIGSIFLQVHFSGPYSSSQTSNFSSGIQYKGLKYTYLKEGSIWELVVLQQAGYSVNGYLRNKVSGRHNLLRGDCILQADCGEMILSGRYNGDDFFIELIKAEDRNVAVLSESRDIVELVEEQTFYLNTHYSFNQFFVMDAALPALHPLLTAELDEKIAYWAAVAKSDFVIQTSAREDLSLLDRFWNRNYVWTQIVHLGDDFISGFIEWIQNDTTKAMGAFLLDVKRSELFWDKEILVNSGTNFTGNGIFDCSENWKGVPVMVPNGIKWVGQLDHLAGRTNCVLTGEESTELVQRRFRKFINPG